MSVAETKKTALGDLFLKPTNAEEDYFYDYDFVVLPAFGDGSCQYIVFKKDLDLYYKNLMDQEPMKKINLDLDNGTVTQVLRTYQLNVV